jgi:hypothetical protein
MVTLWEGIHSATSTIDAEMFCAGWDFCTTRYKTQVLHDITCQFINYSTCSVLSLCDGKTVMCVIFLTCATARREVKRDGGSGKQIEVADELPCLWTRLLYMQMKDDETSSLPFAQYPTGSTSNIMMLLNDRIVLWLWLHEADPIFRSYLSRNSKVHYHVPISCHWSLPEKEETGPHFVPFLYNINFNIILPLSLLSGQFP